LKIEPTQSGGTYIDFIQ